MRIGICWVAVLACAIVTEVAAAPENNSSAKQSSPLIAAQATTQQVDRVIGVCHLSDGSTSDGAMVPSMEMKDYLRKKEHYTIEGAASVSVLQMPAHGTLDGPVNGAFAYLPEKGYIGNDRASLLVEIGGKKIKMEYFFRVMQQVPDQEGVNPYADYCPNKIRVWKISSTLDAAGIVFASYNP